MGGSWPRKGAPLYMLSTIRAKSQVQFTTFVIRSTKTIIFFMKETWLF